MIQGRVLVTGGAGAIGSNIAKVLLTRGCEVVVLDDLSSGYRDLVPQGARFIQGSITEDGALDAAFADKPDYVIHTAALFANQNSVEHPQTDLLVNGLGTIKVLERSVAARVGKLLITSSSCVYSGKALMSETDLDLHPDTPYAITKWLGERYVQYWSEQHGLKAVAVRLFNVYGPGERPGRYRNVIPNFINLAMRGESLTITGTGDETRDFTFMDDAVAGILGAAALPAERYDVFNIGSGRPTKIIDMATKINALTSNKAPIVFVPRRSWDHVPHRLCDVAKSKKAFGLDGKTTLDDGLARTYAWFKTIGAPL